MQNDFDRNSNLVLISHLFTKVQNKGQKRKLTEIDPIDPIFSRTMIFHQSVLTEICYAGKNHSKFVKIEFSKSAAWVT